MVHPPTPYRSPLAFRALDHLARARLYQHAGDQLVDMQSAEPNWPKYFLYGHAVELALKAVPEHFKQSQTYTSPPGFEREPHNHDLAGWYAHAKAHGMPRIQDEAALEDLSKLHRNAYARYPQALRPVWLPSAYSDAVTETIGAAHKIALGSLIPRV